MRNWSAAFILQAKDAKLETHTETLVYDTGSLIGEMGGMLGLTIGWSLYTIFDHAFILSKVFSTFLAQFFKKQNKAKDVWW